MSAAGAMPIRQLELEIHHSTKQNCSCMVLGAFRTHARLTKTTTEMSLLVWQKATFASNRSADL
jgi:hypothetical protein